LLRSHNWLTAVDPSSAFDNKSEFTKQEGVVELSNCYIERATEHLFFSIARSIAFLHWDAQGKIDWS
jgi:hypothetical protein